MTSRFLALLTALGGLVMTASNVGTSWLARKSTPPLCSRPDCGHARDVHEHYSGCDYCSLCECPSFRTELAAIVVFLALLAAALIAAAFACVLIFRAHS